MERNQTLPENAQASLDGIKRSANHMNALISDLLDLARIEAGMAGETEPLDFVQLILDTLPNFDLQVKEKTMQIKTDLPFEPVWVVGNKTRLVQIVRNYFGNALKYTPPAGRVVLERSQRERADDKDGRQRTGHRPGDDDPCEIRQRSQPDGQDRQRGQHGRCGRE